MNQAHTSETEVEQDDVSTLGAQAEAVEVQEDDFRNDALEYDDDMPAAHLPVDATLLRQIIEGALLAAGQPLTVARMLELFDEAVAPTKEAVLAALDEIADDNAARGFELKEVASGYRLQVRKELAPWVNRLWEEKPQKYSRALLETLALIAYRQPITRGDIEEIRGVAVSSHIMKTLMERDWVKIVGQRDVPGRPSLYATTRQFLDYFNLKSLDELPSLSEIRDLDELNAELDLGDMPPSAEDDSDESEELEVHEELAAEQTSEVGEGTEEIIENVSGSLFDTDDEFESDDQAIEDDDDTAEQDFAEQMDTDTDEDYRNA
jgi:segregation and condensation protein B